MKFKFLIREGSEDNWIINLNSAGYKIDPERLIGRYIFINNNDYFFENERYFNLLSEDYEKI